MPDDRVRDERYETDFAAWAEEQALAIRDHLAGGNRPVDWEHVIEEIEGLAASDRQQIRNRLRTAMEHLFKLQFAKAVDPRVGWIETIVEQRRKLEVVLDENRSLRREVASFIARDIGKARQDAAASLSRHRDAGVVDPQATFTADQVLDDWFPPEAS